MTIDGPIERHEVVGSTQDLSAMAVRSERMIGGVLAGAQTAGRGRFDRPWHSPRGACLAVSLILREGTDHRRPYLIGMAVALAAAEAFDLQLQWPNDLVYMGKKVGGLLSEMISNPSSNLVPVVGLGLNLVDSPWPPAIDERATSVQAATGRHISPTEALEQLLARIATVPLPAHWSDLAPRWLIRDATPGKLFRTQAGLKGVAERIGEDGSLILATELGSEIVYAADAIFGS